MMDLLNKSLAILDGEKFDLGEFENTTLIDILYRNGNSYADHVISFIDNSGNTDFISYKDLLSAAQKFAAALQKNGIHSGMKIIPQYRSNKEFIIAVWGAILNAAVPILYKALKSYLNNETEITKLWRISQASNDIIIVYPPELQDEISPLQKDPRWQHMRFVSIVYADFMEHAYTKPMIANDDVALLLPTSGSTGVPKIVQQTHKALLSMSSAVITHWQLTDASISLNWMPLDHVGGFVMFHLRDVVLGSSQYHVETEYILGDPIKLIYLLSNLKISLTWAPNFAFNLMCMALTKLSGNLQDVDLSCVLHIINAGEPVNKNTVKEFLGSFKKYGLSENAMYPVWGMSETCSGVVFSTELTLFDEDIGVSVGAPIPGFAIRIVNSENTILEVNQVGELQVCGPSVTIGYLANEEENNKAFTADHWFKTGDLGVINDYGLTIVGRSKEVIIINGNNFYPQDIESEIEKNINGLDISYTAAISVTNPDNLKEGVVILFVPKVDSNVNDLKINIIKLVTKKFGFRPLDAFSVTRNEIIKTSIGKLQRALIKLKTIPILYRVDAVNTAVNDSSCMDGIAAIVGNVYKKYFGLNSVDSSQDFFMLGGDSIACFQIAKELRDHNINITGPDVFEYTVIADLVDYIKVNNLVLAAPDIIPDYISYESDNSAIPMTELQHVYHIGESRASTLDGITAKTTFEITVNDLDISRLVLAIEQLLNKHKILRGFIKNNKWQIESNINISSVVRDFTDRDTQIEPITLNNNIWPLFKLDVYKNKNNFLIRLATCLVLMDGLSIKNFLFELNEIYHGNNTQDVQFGYISYAKNIELMQTSSQFLAAKDYWTQKLLLIKDYPPLPINGNKILLNKTEQSSYTIKINQHIWQLFKLHAKYNHVTTSMAIFAIFAKILALWSNTEEFSINVLNINRIAMHPDINKQIGNFSNVVLFDTKVSAHEKFDECVKRLQKAYLLDMEHNTYSGVNLINEKNKFTSNASEKFPVAFTSATNYGDFYDGLGEIKRAYVEVPYVLLDFVVFEHKNTLQMVFTVNTSILDSGIVKAMMKSMAEAIDYLANLSSWNTCLNVMPKEQLLVRNRVNATITAPIPKTLLQVFLDNVCKAPQAIAVRHAGVNYSYLELYARAVYLANKIRGMDNFEEAKLIAILMHKCTEQIVAILAIFLSGLAYLPISAYAPIERVKDILLSAKCKIVITQEELFNEAVQLENIEIIYENGKNIINLDMMVEANYHVISNTDLAYVIFTSGSTGKPKGVMISHRAAMNTITDVNMKFKVNASDKFFALSDLGFDLSVYDIFGAFCAGGMVIIPNEEIVRNPDEIYRVLLNEKITIWNSVPAYIQMIIENLLSYTQNQLSLRLIMLSGDWIPVKLARQLIKQLPECQLISFGGATEASIWSNYFVVKQVLKNWRSIPYGKPLANQRYYVLDKNFTDCPDYVAGELYIAGESLAEGYWMDNEKTKEKFIYHPTTHERLYRTGDYGRYWSDGNLEFLGRADSQVKINGFLVEVSEIEGIVSRVDGVLQSTVTIYQAHNGEKLLVAYLVLTDLKMKDKIISSIKILLKNKLPYYMQVAYYMIVQEIALNQNGKVDKKLLPPPEVTKATVDKIKPSNNIEIRLEHLWSKILGVREISVHDNFYALGGHSLAAITLVNGINKLSSFKFSINQLIAAPTIYEQSQLLMSNSAAKLKNKKIMNMNRSDSDIAVIFIHPIGGQVTSYMNLVNMLPNFCCYGIAQDNYGNDVTIQSLAKQYTNAIKKEITMPTILIGWSFGGLIAHEMAVLLAESEHNVLHTFMLDTHLPLNFDTSILDGNMVLNKFIQDVEAQLQLKIDHQVIGESDDVLNSMVDQLNSKSIYEFDLHYIKSMYQFYQSNICSMAKYSLNKSIKDLTLIKANNFNESLNYINPQNINDQEIWQTTSPNMNILSIDGDHYSIVVGNEVSKVVNFINHIYRSII